MPPNGATKEDEAAEVVGVVEEAQKGLALEELRTADYPRCLGSRGAQNQHKRGSVLNRSSDRFYT